MTCSEPSAISHPKSHYSLHVIWPTIGRALFFRAWYNAFPQRTDSFMCQRECQHTMDTRTNTHGLRQWLCSHQQLYSRRSRSSAESTVLLALCLQILVSSPANHTCQYGSSICSGCCCKRRCRRQRTGTSHCIARLCAIRSFGRCHCKTALWEQIVIIWCTAIVALLVFKQVELFGGAACNHCE